MSLAIAGYLPHIPMPPPPRYAQQPPERHGHLEVVERLPQRPDLRGARIRCRCLLCGSLVDVRSDHLKDERRPRTCGCGNPKRRRIWRWWLE